MRRGVRINADARVHPAARAFLRFIVSAMALALSLPSCSATLADPESERSFCMRYGRSCGVVRGQSEDGTSRTVDCGLCVTQSGGGRRIVGNDGALGETDGGAGADAGGDGGVGPPLIDPLGPSCGWPFVQPTVHPSQTDAVIIGAAAGMPAFDRFRVRVGWPSFNPIEAVTWDVGAFTGFQPGDFLTHQRGHKNEYPDSAVQVSESSNTVGMWLNSLEEAPSFATQPDVSINAGCWYGGVLPQAFPGATGSLHVRFDLQVPYAGSVGPANAGMVGFNFMFAELQSGVPTGRTFWYAISVFDLRTSIATWHAVQPDTSGTTSSAILGSSIDVPGWFTKSPSSAGFRSVQYGTFANYDFEISPSEFLAAVTALRGFGNGYGTLSLDARDYAVLHFNIGPEFHDVDPAGWVQVGVAVRNLTVERRP